MYLLASAILSVLMLSATCPYAACDDGYKFMEVLRAQIRMWRGSNKTEFQCRSGLFQFLQAFQTFHNTHFPPVRPANDTEFGRAMHVLNDLKRAVLANAFQGDALREILEIVFPNGSGVWFTLDNMKSMLPAIHAILWNHVKAPDSWAPPVVEQATPVVPDAAPVIDDAELTELLNIRLSPMTSFLHETTPVTLPADTFGSGADMVDRKNNANLVRAMFESGLSYEDRQLSWALGTGSSSVEYDQELANALEQSELEEAIRRSLGEGPMDLDN
jgi:hypothetical protein